MAQWIALAITITGSVIVGSVLWGRMSQRQDNFETRLKTLEEDSQTPTERRLIADALDTRFKAHDALDDIRFANLQEAIHAKLDAIMKAVCIQGNGR